MMAYNLLPIFTTAERISQVADESTCLLVPGLFVCLFSSVLHQIYEYLWVVRQSKQFEHAISSSGNLVVYTIFGHFCNSCNYAPLGAPQAHFRPVVPTFIF